MKKHTAFLRNTHGIAALEFALMLPVLMLILLGVLEFGIYFTKSSVVSRAVSSTSNAVQLMPNNATLQTDAQNSGFGLVNFTGQNYFCAMSYSTRALAEAGMCNSNTQWATSTPAGHPAGTPYYVAIVAFVKNAPLTPLTSFLPDITLRNIVQVGGSASNSRKGYVRIGASTNTTSYNHSTAGAMSGNWTVPEGVTDIKVTLVGGGTTGSSLVDNATGGQSGNVLVATISDLTPGTSIAYTVAGSTAGSLDGAATYSGGSTTFNGLSASTGGTFSSSGVTSGTLLSAVRYPSNMGAPFHANGSWMDGGPGGDTPLGFGEGGTAPSNYGFTNQIDGRGYGSGGAGQTNSGTTRRTGNGAPGVIVIEW